MCRALHHHVGQLGLQASITIWRWSSKKIGRQGRVLRGILFSTKASGEGFGNWRRCRLFRVEMSSDSGIHKADAAAPPVQQQQSCRKKKADVDEGFVKDLINHIDEFVHASYDEHKTCLSKTVRKLFEGMSRIGQSPPASGSPPTHVVSVLPLRVNTD